jgi:polysaccharide export outer membrane protein
MDSRIARKWPALLLLPGLCLCAPRSAAAQAALSTDLSSATTTTDYVVGAQDMLTFTYPLIGRVKAGNMTLRQIEAEVKKQLKDEGFFNNPQITVSIEQYKSQKIFVVGEVRTPGSYPLSGDMNLVEALARAGSTLPTASGEVVIVHPTGGHASGPVLPNQDGADNVVRIDIRDLQNGTLSQNAALRDGDTIFVPRAESVYVFGQVKNPGAYPLQQKNTTVLQALSLAGGVTDRGSTGRIKIVRVVNGEKQELKVKLGDLAQPGDTIIVQERFF